PRIDVTPDEVRHGDTVTVDGSDFTPGTTVTVVYTDSAGEVLAEREVTVRADGTFTATFGVPEGAAVGVVPVTAAGDGESATGTVPILSSVSPTTPPRRTPPPSSGSLPTTGVDSLPLALLAALVVVTGAGATLWSRLRRSGS